MNKQPEKLDLISPDILVNLPEKLKLEREKHQLDAKRDEAWKEYELAAHEIEAKKDALMDEVEKRLQQQVSENELFIIRWRVS